MSKRVRRLNECCVRVGSTDKYDYCTGFAGVTAAGQARWFEQESARMKKIADFLRSEHAK